MAIIAKGMITLANVNDAYSVLTTPNVCAIKADFDGSNPILNDAYCDISVLRGDVKVPFEIASISLSNADIRYETTGDSYNQRFILTSIPIDISSGSITIEVATEDGFVANAIFQYNVIRDATMLDWIQDWETNKTSIGSTYLITPKLFVGKKVFTEDELATLTGVYIGPDSDGGAGIYGLKEGVDVFHINEEGASIGGWAIVPGGIQTVDGTLQLLSEGSVIATNEESNVIWGLYKSGEAVFANGKVRFHADGNAEFEGKLSSSEGVIGHWNIGEQALYSEAVCLDPINNYIGIKALDNTRSAQTPEYDTDATVHYTNVMAYGGVYMYCQDSANYGLVGYLPQIDSATRKVFSIGSENMIAGWNFDESAIWVGSKTTTAGEYTDTPDSITIGLDGLRSFQWRLENNGSGALAGGKIEWSEDGTLRVGDWSINNGTIVSSLDPNSHVLFDASSQTITLYNNNLSLCVEDLDCESITESRGFYSSHITMSASDGIIKAMSLYGLGGVLPKTYMSPYGICANYSGLLGAQSDTFAHCASIVGIGNGNKIAATWSESGDENCVVGVYGKANNQANAPAYGGYFENLKACGLMLSRKIITDSTQDNEQITSNQTLVVGTADIDKTIVLPSGSIEGRVIVIQQIGTGKLEITAPSGTRLNLNGNSLLLSQNEGALAFLVAYKQSDSTLKYVWIINKFNNA